MTGFDTRLAGKRGDMASPSVPLNRDPSPAPEADSAPTGGQVPTPARRPPRLGAARRRLPDLLAVAGLLLTAALWGRSLPTVAAAAVGLVLAGAVLMAVTHAEAIAHQVGEPFGTLTLALAVTIIEVGLIVTLSISDPVKSATLARDTVFAAVMIVCNGIVGMALVVNARATHLVRFNEQGAYALLGTVLTLATVSLVMPTFTSSSFGPTYTGAQLAFAAVASATLYGMFVFVQTVRHRWMFLSEVDPQPVPGEPPGPGAAAPAATGVAAAPAGAADAAAGHDGGHGAGPGGASLVGLVPPLLRLLAMLTVVVGLAKTLSGPIEEAVAWAGAPASFVGVVIALLVLAPESVAAFRAAARGEMQTSLNLALGSGLASIGLTIPAIAIASIWLAGPIELGLGAKEIVLLAATGVISALTFGSGRATVLQATHHLAVFAAFIFLALVP